MVHPPCKNLSNTDMTKNKEDKSDKWSSNNNQTPAQANVTKNKYHRFLQRGIHVRLYLTCDEIVYLAKIRPHRRKPRYKHHEFGLLPNDIMIIIWQLSKIGKNRHFFSICSLGRVEGQKGKNSLQQSEFRSVFFFPGHRALISFEGQKTIMSYT